MGKSLIMATCNPDGPLVTIITPAYNAAPYIAATIRAVQAQTYTTWEWLIADDGSTDATCALVDAAADPRIRLLRSPHSGLPAVGRNRGLAHARGQIVALLDADDCWLPDKLACQLDLLAAQPAVGLVFSRYIEWREGATRPGRSLPALRGIPRSGRLLPHLALRNFILTSSVVVRRALLDGAGGFDEDPCLAIAEDYELWLRLASQTCFAWVARPLLYYRIHPASYSNNLVLTVERLRAARRRAAERSPAVRDGLAGLETRLLARWLLELGRAHLLAGSAAQGRQALGQSLRLWPGDAHVWVWLALSLLPTGLRHQAHRWLQQIVRQG